MKHWAWAGVALVLVGCRAPSSAPITQVALLESQYVPSERSENAYDGYVLAGREAADKLPESYFRANVTSSTKKEILEQLAGPIRDVVRATRKPCRFEFRSSKPFESRPELGGWAAIGDCLVWQVEAHIQEERYAQAVEPFLAAVRFGFDLTGGSAAEAATGFALVQRARQAMAPGVDGLSISQKRALAQSFSEALDRMPPFDQLAEHEALQMRRAVDEVAQWRSLAKKDPKAWEDLEAKLGPLAYDVAKTIQNLEPERAAEFFQKWADEVPTEVNMLKSRAQVPVAKRGEWPLTTMKGRPWGELSKIFFRGGRSVLPMRDEALARTRLFIEGLRISAELKERGEVSAKRTSLPMDPYSGQPLIYRGTGSTYQLYSVGENGRDDGGRSDVSLRSPDILCEIAP